MAVLTLSLHHPCPFPSPPRRGAGLRVRRCMTCKARKVKCDQRKPACLRCAQSNLECQGYMSEADFLFRNEVPALERKLGVILTPRDVLTSCSRSTSSSPALEWLIPRISPVPHSAVVEQDALAFFASRYVITQPEGCTEPTGYLQCLPPLLDGAPTDSCLAEAVRATAMSTLAKERRDPRMNMRARKFYATALSRTNSALSNMEEALQDDTLLAVHILGVYETINTTTRDLSAMFRHTIGAASIITIRGPEMIETANGSILFMLNQSWRAMMSLVNRKHPPISPPEPENLGQRNAQTKKSMDIILQVPSLLEQFDSIRDREYTRPPSSLQIQELISPVMTKAMDLDTKLDSWSQHLPASWAPVCTLSSNHSFGCTTSTMPPLFFPHPSTGTIKAYQYVNIWIASVLNFTRSVRIVLHLLCLDALSYADPGNPHSLRIEQSKKVIQDQVDLICANIASTLGCQIHDTKSYTVEDAEADARALGGYFLLWPIYNCLQAPFLPSSQRQWLQSWLRFISSARDLSSLTFECCWV